MKKTFRASMVHKRYLLLFALFFLASIASFAQQRGEEMVTFGFRCGNIITETEVINPPDRTRKKLGVGEKVNLKLDVDRGVVEWVITSGKASFNEINDVQTINAIKPDLYIRETTGKVKVVAKIEKCSGYPTESFTIVRPTEINFDCGNYGAHRQGYPSAGITANLYVYPDDVSFYNLEFQEQNQPVTSTTTYWKGLFHNQGSWKPLKANNTISGLGTGLDDGYEDYIAICGVDKFAPNTGQGGTTTCDIPVKFRIKNNNIEIPK
jgi:hypothetical protein